MTPATPGCLARLACSRSRAAVSPVTPVFRIRISVGDRTPTANPLAAAAWARAGWLLAGSAVTSGAPSRMRVAFTATPSSARTHAAVMSSATGLAGREPRHRLSHLPGRPGRTRRQRARAPALGRPAGCLPGCPEPARSRPEQGAAEDGDQRWSERQRYHHRGQDRHRERRPERADQLHLGHAQRRRPGCHQEAGREDDRCELGGRQACSLDLVTSLQPACCACRRRRRPSSRS